MNDVSKEVEYEVWQDNACVAGSMGEQTRTLAEIKHYASQYEQDGPIKVYEITRREVDLVAPAVANAAARIVTKETAEAYLEETLWDFIEISGNFPSIKTDPRTWEHVMVYAPVSASAPNAQLVEALLTIAAQSSGIPGSTARADCMAAIARAALANAGVTVKE